MKLKEALFLTGQAELYYDGYTMYIEEQEEDETYGISIQTGQMPPHFTKNDLTWEQLQAEIAETHAPNPQNWTPVQPD